VSLLRPKKARTRIALAGAALSALLLLLLAVGVRTGIRHRTFRSVDEGLRTLAIALGSDFELEGLHHREMLAPELQANLFEFRLENHSAILFDRGGVLAVSGDLLRREGSVDPGPYRNRSGEPFTAREPYSGQRRICRFVVLPLAGKAAGARLVLFRSIEPTLASLQGLDGALVGLCLAGFLGTAAILAFVLHRAFRPVEEVTRLAESVDASDLSRRVRVARGGEELERLTGVINSLLERLGLSFQAQRRLVADAAHELKTPIAVVLGEAQDALRPEARGEERRRSLEAIEHAARGLARQVENLLSLARGDAAAPAAIEDVDLSEIVAASVEAAHAFAAPRGVRFEVFVDGGARVRGDRNALLRLTANLVSNAAIYSGPGTSVEVACGKRGGDAYLEVRDHGPGVPLADRRRIFERFVRLPGARASHPEGSGLGLAIVEQVALAHGGRVEVEDRPGGGTVFRAVIPAAQ
jgi:signal transduction histidine kinase